MQQNEEVPENCIQRVSLFCCLPGCPDVQRLATSLLLGMIASLSAKGQNLEKLVTIGSSAELQSG